MTVGLTVCLRAAPEAPAAYNTAETLALGGADHLDWLSNFKYIGLDFLSDFKFGKVVDAELLQVREPST